MLQRSRTSRPSLHLEALEPRLLLSGNVLVDVVGGDLVVTGDALDNEITVEQTGAEQYTVTGVDTTTVNGGAAFVANGVRDDFEFDMGAGDDFVDVIGNTLVPDDIRADMGDGDNQFRIQDFTSVGDDLEVNAGDGDDEVQTWNDAVVGDDVDVRIGNGENKVQIWNRSDIGGNVDIQTGSGADDIMIWNDTQIDGKVKIDTGAGADTVDIRNEAHFARNLDIRTGGSDDIVLFLGTSGTGVTLDGKAKISTDDKTAGNDTVEIRDAVFGRDLKIDTASGGGIDTVRIDDTTVGRKVDIRTKGKQPDDDTIEIGLFADGLGLTTDHLKISTGGGDDDITLANSTVNKRADIRTETGMDVVDIFDSDFLSNLKVKMGDGDDTLATDTGGNFVAKRTDFDGGDGNDTLTTSLTNVFNGEKIKGFPDLS